jgi:hypothetical protein
MGWAGKLFVLLAVLVSFATGLWFIGILAVIYLAVSFRPGKGSTGAAKNTRHPPFRLLLTVGLFFLAGVAVIAGGTFSPVVLFSAGSIVVLWPHLRLASIFSLMVPVEDSILLRSKYVPFLWYALAEVKPGPEDFPRAAASLSGTLVIFVDAGRAYALAECRAWNRISAEAQLISRFKAFASGRRSRAYVLPLDAGVASKLFLHKFSKTRIPEDIATHASSLPSLLVVCTLDGRIDGASGYMISEPSDSPSIPARCNEIQSKPLLWELLDNIGKRSRWPAPDAYSNLLDSVAATRGEPIGERLGGIEGSGASLTVQSLGGERLELSRPQLRAIVSIYS